MESYEILKLASFECQLLSWVSETKEDQVIELDHQGLGLVEEGNRGRGKKGVEREKEEQRVGKGMR